MFEQKKSPEAQQEFLASEIEARLTTTPEIPEDRGEIYRSLARNKEVALAGLVTALIMFSGTEAKGELYYERPDNVKISETELLQNFKKGDENTAYRYGKELLQLTTALAEQDPESVEYGEASRAIIAQLARMMRFCEKQKVPFARVYDTSKIRPDLLRAAQTEVASGKKAALGRPEQPTRPERTIKKDETLGRTSR